MTNNYSNLCFEPRKNQISPIASFREPTDLQDKAESFVSELSWRVTQKNYPCVAAIQSYFRNEYQVGFYGAFGSGNNWRSLRQDLLLFLKRQKETNSKYLSFWAVFEPELFSESEYEKALWRELSFLTSEEDRGSDWPNAEVSNPNSPNFRFALGSSEFFVVGMHSQSSRLARRWSTPALIFNVFSQFETLKSENKYDSMVTTNRARDVSFQGSANPMVEQHGEQWESIQFSGRNNESSWQCPFHFLKQNQKP